MVAQPLDDSRFSDRELLGVLAERVGGMKETFDDFRAETRNNFDAAKTSINDLKSELKQDGLAIREEMRAGFQEHDKRITSLEREFDTAKGGFGVSKWIWGASLAAIGAAGTIIGIVAK